MLFFDSIAGTFTEEVGNVSQIFNSSATNGTSSSNPLVWDLSTDCSRVRVGPYIFFRNGSFLTKIMSMSFTVNHVDQTITYVTSTMGSIYKFNNNTDSFDFFYAPNGNTTAFSHIRSYGDRIIVNESTSIGAWVEAYVVEGNTLSKVFSYESMNFFETPMIETSPDLSQVLIVGLTAKL